MTYTVLFPETQYSVINKLQEIKKTKEAAWFSGCYHSGKTYLIRQIFNPDYIFEYPTQSFRDVLNDTNHEDDYSWLLYSSYIQGIPQLPKFMNAYLSWTERELGLTPSARLTSSKYEPQFVAQLVKHHGNLLRNITWLIQVNIFDPLDRNFVTWLSNIHTSIVQNCGQDKAPNLIFESWFTDGAGQIQPIISTIAKDKPGYKTPDRPPLRLVKERIPIRQKVFRSPIIDDVYDDALKTEFCSNWIHLQDDEETLQIMCDFVKEWSGYHFGSIKFVLAALKENETWINTNVTFSRLDTLLFQHIQDYEDRFVILIDTLRISLNLHAWAPDDIYRNRIKLINAGIDLASLDEEPQLIKLVKYYRDNHEAPISSPLVPQDREDGNEMSHQYERAVSCLTEWVESAPRNHLPDFDDDLTMLISESPPYSPDNLMRLGQNIVRFLVQDGVVLSQDLYPVFWEPFVGESIDVFQQILNDRQQMGRWRIFEMIKDHALHDRKLHELVEIAREYRSR